MKKLIIAAGTGFLGQVLITHFENKVEDIVVLTRGKSTVKKKRKIYSLECKNHDGLGNRIGRCRRINQSCR